MLPRFSPFAAIAAFLAVPLAGQLRLEPLMPSDPRIDASLAAVARDVTGVELPSTRPVLHDADGNGRLFALGNDWKMVFAADGARFLPVLGERAPRRMPLHFALGKADAPVAPARDGDRVVYRRAGHDEIYDLRPGHVEQSFLLRERPGADEFVLPLATELRYAGRDRKGLRFETLDLGGVSYGDAVAIDARGARLELPVDYRDGAIRVPMPREWFAGATYPVLIDPVLQTFQVAGATQDATQASVAYADSVNVFQVSYLVTVAADDRDVLAVRYSPSGALLDSVALDLTDADTSDLDVAFSSPHFLTVWVNAPGLGNNGGDVMARARVAGSTAVASTFKVSGTGTIRRRPVVGGGGPGGRFLVAWGQTDLLVRPQLAARLVSAAGTQGGVLDLFTTFLFGVDHRITPDVSPTPDSSGRWLVAFDRDNDVSGAQVDTNGSVVGSVFSIATSSTEDEIEPAIATAGNAFFTVWEQSVGTRRELRGRRITGGASPVLGPVVDLSGLQPGVSPANSQRQPKVSWDGVRFALAYLEGSTLRAATFFTQPSLSFQEGHVLLDGTSGARRDRAAIASAGLDVPGRHFVVWTRTSETRGPDTVQAALWNSLATGGLTRLDTGCGGPAEPIVFSNSVPALGSECSVLFLGFNALLVAVGTPGVFSACPNTSCQFGVGIASFLTGPPNAILTFSIGTGPALLGTQIAVQGADFLAPATASEFCSSPTTTRMTTSDTLVFTVQ